MWGARAHVEPESSEEQTHVSFAILLGFTKKMRETNLNSCKVNYHCLPMAPGKSSAVSNQTSPFFFLFYFFFLTCRCSGCDGKGAPSPPGSGIPGQPPRPTAPSRDPCPRLAGIQRDSHSLLLSGLKPSLLGSHSHVRWMSCASREGMGLLHRPRTGQSDAH